MSIGMTRGDRRRFGGHATSTKRRWRVGVRVTLSVLLAAAAARPAEVSGPVPVLPFIDDDYARARAEARARELPLFIEAWAPW